MNVLHVNFDVSRDYPYWMGGVPSVIQNIMKYSNKTLMQSYLLTYNKDVSKCTRKNNLVFLPFSKTKIERTFFSRPAFIKLLLKDMDIVNCHHPSLSLPLRILMKLIKPTIRIIETIYSRSIPVCSVLSNLFIDHFITIDDDLKNEMINKGYNPKKISICSVFPDFEKFDMKKFKENRNHKNFRILYSTGPRKEMGLHYFLNEIKKIRYLQKSKHNFTYFIAVPKQNKKVKEYVNKFVSNNQLFNTVVVDYAFDFPKFLSSVDAVVFPIQKHQAKMNTPLTLLEAMAMGKLIIAIPTGGIYNVVNDKNAIIFDGKKLNFSDIIRNFDKYDIEKLEKEAIKRVKRRFDPNYITRKLYYVYLNLLNKNLVRNKK